MTNNGIRILGAPYDFDKYNDKIQYFNCGDSQLNRYLINKSKLSSSTTRIILDKNSKIVAFISYRCSAIIIDEKPHPAIEIRAFAINENLKKVKLKTKNKTIAHIILEKLHNKFY